MCMHSGAMVVAVLDACALWNQSAGDVAGCERMRTRLMDECVPCIDLNGCTCTAMSFRVDILHVSFMFICPPAQVCGFFGELRFVSCIHDVDHDVVMIM